MAYEVAELSMSFWKQCIISIELFLYESYRLKIENYVHKKQNFRHTRAGGRIWVDILLIFGLFHYSRVINVYRQKTGLCFKE